MKQDFDRVTPYIYLTQAAPLTAGEHIVEAVVPTRQERELLQLEDHEPGLLIHRRTWSGKTVVTSARLLYPGSRYQLFGRFTSEV
ncbi:UTRA domain protein [compost metagenome]